MREKKESEIEEAVKRLGTSNGTWDTRKRRKKAKQRSL